MATPRFAWGIDIGNRALKAVKLVREEGGLRVDGFEVIEHETVLSESGDNREQLIQTALTSFVQRHLAKGGEVAIGVSGQSSFARFIKLPPVEKSKIPEIVRFEAIQQIPFPLDDVEWSYQLFQEPESADVEVGIFAMRKELVNRQLQFFTEGGLDVGLIQMNPLAVYNAMYYDQRVKGTTMIIDLGAENTDLIIAEGESIWLRSIPIGGNNFTEALTKAFKMKFEKAEELKRNAATSKYGRQILQAMRPIFADLVAEIQRSIGFYASVHRDSRIQRVLALGGTFRLPGLQKYLQQNLQLDVQRIDSMSGGAPADARVAAMFSENLLSSVGAYGLALQAMGEGKINSSLLPLPIRRARMWREKTKWFGAAAAVFVLGLVGVPMARYFYEDYQLTRAKEAHDGQIRQAINEATNLDAEYARVSEVNGPDRDKIKSINGLLSYRDLWPKLLKDLDSAMPNPGPDVLSGDVERIKKVPRAQRKQLVVERFTAVYHSGLRTILKMSDDELKNQVAAGSVYTDTTSGLGGGGMMGRGMFGGMGMYGGMGGGMMSPYGMPGGMSPYGMPGRGGMSPYGGLGGPGGGMVGAPPEFGGVDLDKDGAEGGPKRRGFVITIRCTTPYGKYTELAAETQKALLDLSPDKYGPQGPYRVERVIVPLADKLKKEEFVKASMTRRQQAVRQQQMPQPGQRLPGQAGGDANAPMRPLAPNARGVAPTEQADDLFVDPLTKESLVNDYQLTLLAVVMLDPEPEKKEEGGSTVDTVTGAPVAGAAPTDAAQTAGDGSVPTPAVPGDPAPTPPPASPDAAAVPGAVPADPSTPAGAVPAPGGEPAPGAPPAAPTDPAPTPVPPAPAPIPGGPPVPAQSAGAPGAPTPVGNAGATGNVPTGQVR